jgi:hypothetical protein
MLTPELQSLISRFGLRALATMRQNEHPERQALCQDILRHLADLTNAGLLVAEDFEAAELSQWQVGQTQLRLRALERWRQREAAERGFDLSNEEVVDRLGNVDVELLRHELGE